MKKYLAIILLVVSIVFALAPFVYYGGFNPSRFPVAEVQPLINPSAYAFLIWAVIDIWLVVAAFFGWRRHERAADWQKMRIPLIISLAVGVFWGPAERLGYVGSFVVILIMWVMAARALRKGPLEDKIIGIYPVGLYVGWLSAACGVEFGVMLLGLGWVSDSTSAIWGLGLAAFLALFVIYRSPFAFTVGLAAMWALVAIVVRNMGDDGSMTIATIAGVGAVLVGISGWRRWKIALTRKPIHVPL